MSERSGSGAKPAATKEYMDLSQELSIQKAFFDLKTRRPERLKARLNVSWSNWAFGREELARSLERLSRANVSYLELAGLSSDAPASPIKRQLDAHGIALSGICGAFSPMRDLSGVDAGSRRCALEYIQRNLDVGQALGAEYFLLLPGANGRTTSLDADDEARSLDALRSVADRFRECDIKGAIEPVCASEVSFCHTIADALDYIDKLDHPGIRHVNADCYHMVQGHEPIGASIVRCGEKLVNIHVADTNRGALGTDALDVDTLIMALYIVGHNRTGRFVTFEPIDARLTPYEFMQTHHSAAWLDSLVMDTISFFRKREELLLSPLINEGDYHPYVE